MAAVAERDVAAMECRALDGMSLGGVAAMKPQPHLPRKYKEAAHGEVSTFVAAGVVPVTRTETGEARVLLWQPQSGNKSPLRWFDFGGHKETRAEFTSACACRKLAKQTYGIFGCELAFSEGTTASHNLQELYQGLANLPLMLRASQEWAQLQLLDGSPRIFYSDIHEYHAYLLVVPHVAPEVLNRISELVDGGKRVFRWFTADELKEEVLAPRLHTDSFSRFLQGMQEDEWITQGDAYGDATFKPATGCFSAEVL